MTSIEKTNSEPSPPLLGHFDGIKDMVPAILSYLEFPSEGFLLLRSCKGFSERRVKLMTQTNQELKSQFREELGRISQFATAQLDVLEAGIETIGPGEAEALRQQAQDALSSARIHEVYDMYRTLVNRPLKAIRQLLDREPVDAQDLRTALNRLHSEMEPFLRSAQEAHDNILGLLNSKTMKLLCEKNALLRQAVEQFRNDFLQLFNVEKMRQLYETLEILEPTDHAQIEELYPTFLDFIDYSSIRKLHPTINFFREDLLSTLQPERLRQKIEKFSEETTSLTSDLHLGNAGVLKDRILDKLFELFQPLPRYQLLSTSLSLSNLSKAFATVQEVRTEWYLNRCTDKADEFFRKRLFHATLASLLQMEKSLGGSWQPFLDFHINTGLAEEMTKLVLLLPEERRQRHLFEHIVERVLAIGQSCSKALPAAQALFERHDDFDRLSRVLLRLGDPRHLPLMRTLIERLPQGHPQRDALLAHAVEFMIFNFNEALTLIDQIQDEEIRNSTLLSAVRKHLDTSLKKKEYSDLDQIFARTDPLPQSSQKTSALQLFAIACARAERFDLIEKIEASAGNLYWLTMDMFHGSLFMNLDQALIRAILGKDQEKAARIVACFPEDEDEKTLLKKRFDEAFPKSFIASLFSRR